MIHILKYSHADLITFSLINKLMAVVLGAIITPMTSVLASRSTDKIAIVATGYQMTTVIK